MLRQQLLLNTMVSLPPPPAMEVLLLTTAEKTRESPSPPPETELVTKLAPVVEDQGVCSSAAQGWLCLLPLASKVRVSLSAPKSMSAACR